MIIADRWSLQRSEFVAASLAHYYYPIRWTGPARLRTCRQQTYRSKLFQTIGVVIVVVVVQRGHGQFVQPNHNYILENAQIALYHLIFGFFVPSEL